MSELITKSTFPALRLFQETDLAKHWERWEGFRFTFLRHFTRPVDSAALQMVAQLLLDLILDKPPEGGELPPGVETRSELTAALADLRFLQAYLTSVSEEERLCSLPEEAQELCRMAGALALEVEGMTRRLSAALFPKEG